MPTNLTTTLPKIYIAAEHCGVNLKQFLLGNTKLELIDIYPINNPEDDYPDVAKILAQKLLDNPNDFGIVICGSGQGIAMSANRFSHIRCAIPLSVEAMVKTREHNNTNVISFSASIEQQLALKIVETMVISPKSEVLRHTRRVAKMCDINFTNLS